MINLGTHSGRVIWTKFEYHEPPRQPNSPPPAISPFNGDYMRTIVKLSTLSDLIVCNGWYNFRIGATYKIHLINGSVASAKIITNNTQTQA
jgi:hypothetical protein